MASSASQSDVELSRVAMAIIRLPLRNRHSGTDNRAVRAVVCRRVGVWTCAIMLLAPRPTRPERPVCQVIRRWLSRWTWRTMDEESVCISTLSYGFSIGTKRKKTSNHRFVTSLARVLYNMQTPSALAHRAHTLRDDSEILKLRASISPPMLQELRRERHALIDEVDRLRDGANLVPELE